jgi:DNA-binding transcriptional LysR family regulator
VNVKGAQLMYFVTVAEEGQITRAARKLNIAQPALSQSMANLEAELGFPLLSRHPRGVTLTTAGETFFVKAKAALEAAADAEDTARSLARAARGALEIGFLASPPVLHSAELFGELALRHPEIECRFHEMPFPSGSAASWLEGFDIAIGVFAYASPGVLHEPMRDEPRVLVLPRGHRLAGREQVSVQEVMDERFLGIDPRVDQRWAGFWTLDDHRGGPPAQVTADQAENAQDLLVMIAAGRGVMALPACHGAVIKAVLPNIAVVPIADAAPGILALVWLEACANDCVRPLVTIARELRESAAAAEIPVPSAP